MDLNSVEKDKIVEMFGNFNLAPDPKVEGQKKSRGSAGHTSIDYDGASSSTIGTGEKQQSKKAWKGSNTKKEQGWIGGKDNTDSNGNKEVNAKSQFASRRDMIDSIMSLHAKKFSGSTSKTKRVDDEKAKEQPCLNITDNFSFSTGLKEALESIATTSVVNTASVNLNYGPSRSANNTISVVATPTSESSKKSTALAGKKKLTGSTSTIRELTHPTLVSSPPVVPPSRMIASNNPNPKLNPHASSLAAAAVTSSSSSVTTATTGNQVGSESNNSGNPRQSMLKLLQAYKEKREAAQTEQIVQREREAAKINAPRRIFNESKVPLAILEQKRLLPIYSRKKEILELVKKNQFIIIIGETGSGKSTQLPQYLVEAGLHGTGKIGVTQPRRVAAKSLADRVAKECGVKVGTAVGYAVRFDSKISDDTVIKYMTDGLLVKECTTEANLDRYSIIIIDEAHERSIHTDICFGLLMRAARKRPDLKVIISSATLEELKFSKYFKNAPVFNVSGKGYEVELIYNPKTEYDYLQGAVDTIVSINRKEPRGDILVFLSGQDEIEQIWDMLEAKMGEMANSLYDELVITPCYGALPFEEQQKIFDETAPNCRKIVLATNIAETSVTIEGIVYVIDCGYFKQNEYNPRTGISSLVKQRITKFQAIQRMGRAGRTRAGKCYRLYSKFEFGHMKEATSPEITRCNVESVILDLISMGISDPLTFEFMDPPSQDAVMEAIEHLQELSALDSQLEITYLGRRMSEFPLDPPLAKVLLESEKLGCSSEVLKIVALLSTQYQNIFLRGKRIRKFSDLSRAKFDHKDGDLLTLLRVYDAWLINGQSESWCQSMYIQHRHLVEAEEIREQLKTILNSRGMSQNYSRGAVVCPTLGLYEHIRKAFTAGYFRQLAKKKLSGHAYQVLCDVLNSENAFIHPSSSVFNNKHPWVIYHEVTKTSKAYMKGVIAIEPAWIAEYAPEFARKMACYGIPVPQLF